MAEASQIMDRIRSHGANILLDAGRLKLINKDKLPEGAMDFIRANAKAIADFLDQEGELEERAAIVEHEAKAPREVAESFARLCIGEMTKDWSEIDRSWAIGLCAKIIDQINDINMEQAA